MATQYHARMIDIAGYAGAARIAYVDPFSGASGDMILGALLDSGLSLDALTAALQTLPLPHWQLQVEQVQRGAIGATFARVVSDEQDPPHRHLADVLRIIDAGTLPGDAAVQARAVFTRLAEAEAHVHRTSIDAVHFHEVGAIDAIVDICGATTGLALLGASALYCGPLPLGSGTVDTAHGILPLPAPATLELLARAGAPTVPHGARTELVTPTGAALLTTLARFERPAMHLQAVGYGAGSRSVPTPNVLRLLLGRPNAEPQAGQEETLTMLECNIDDMNPQWNGHLFERLLEQGALDVTCTATLMKKGRPGQVLGVLCRPEHRASLISLLMSETTTLGVRHYPVQRQAAARAMHWVQTVYGPVPIKLRIVAERVTGATPEYEACRAAAHAAHVPLPLVTAAAQAAAYP
ncbi:MAG TPA: nickel pincer cofactor biosynthesis protein LarC, partial [Chloroflexota bacterium]|nr:nickel pincer cofactor biosynthesis protein LarC [Chloroflexota bacterium]